MTYAHQTSPAKQGASQSLDLSKTISVRAANDEYVWRVSRNLVFAILLVRSVCDPIFNLTGGGAENASVGVGAAVNALALVIACVLVAQRPSTAPSAVYGIWAPFLLITFVSVVYAPQFTSGARVAFGILTYWAFFAIPFLILRSSSDLSRFVLLVVASSIGPSLYALWDIRLGLSDMADFRLQSTFSHANIFAFYLVLVLGLALYVRSSAAIKVSPRIRMMLTLYVPVLVIFLALTKTRSAWIAGGLTLLVYGLRIDRRFLLGLLLIPLLLAFDPSLVGRLTDLTGETEIESYRQLNETYRLNSYEWRQALWEAAMPAIAEHPLLGHGLESFRRSTPDFFALTGPEGIDAHNAYLQVSYEMGLLGTVALAWIFIALAWRLVSGRRYDPSGMLVMLCVLGGYVLECYADNMLFYLSFNWYFWFVMGTVCAWLERQRIAPAGSLVSAETSSARPGPRNASAHATFPASGGSFRAEGS